MSDSRAAYRALLQRLMRSAADQGQPVNAAFELTSRCNLACRMCYIRDEAHDKACRARELSAEQWVRLASEAREHGLVFLQLTGGEVFLRPDFFEIYEPLSRLGLMLTLFTNGTMVTEAVADRLADAPPSRTEISLYGATQASYETVTGVPGSYRRCLDGIERLVARGLPLKLKSTLNRHNVAELEAMRALAHGYGLPFSAAWLLSRRIDERDSAVYDCRLAPSECITLESDDRARRGLANAKPSADHGNFYCRAGRSSFMVDSEGRMHVCIDLRLPGVRPLETGFAAAWAEVQAVVQSAPDLDPECQTCSARGHCGRCPAWSYLETGTMTRPVPYLCEIAFERQSRYADA